MSENQYPPTKPVCQLDTDNLYLHQTEADLDPLAEDGSYLLPAGCIDAEPPEARAGFSARWLPERAEWQYLPDHRGKTAYRTADGAEVRIEQAGGCKGEAPEQVAAFAKPAGKTACEATDIIIAQADKLRTAMGRLGVLRMRKFELETLKTAEEVNKRVAEILAEIQPIADKLCKVGENE